MDAVLVVAVIEGFSTDGMELGVHAMFTQEWAESARLLGEALARFRHLGEPSNDFMSRSGSGSSYRPGRSITTSPPSSTTWASIPELRP